MSWFRHFLLKILFLPPEVSSFSAHLDNLHFVVIITTMLGAVGVCVAALYFIVKYRRRSESETTERITIPVWLEVPAALALLSLFIVWWAAGYKQYVGLHETPDDAMRVYVTGKQWMWKFAYENGRKTAGLLVVPEGHPVQLRITSRDVVHSFYVPAFRIKQDAVPGQYATTWFEADEVGTFQAFCAEYCGTSHSQMWAKVVVLDPADYQRWLDGEKPEAVARAESSTEGVGEQAPGLTPAGDLVAQGRQAAAKYGCLSCHTLDGQRHIGPTWRGLYGSKVTLSDGSTIVADDAYLTQSMMDPGAKIVDGYPSVMPSFAGVLNQEDVGPILELIRSLRKQPGVPPPVKLPKVTAEPGTQGQTDGGIVSEKRGLDHE